ncbi:unnamed protein product, partial [Rotaria magnacalcarata]
YLDLPRQIQSPKQSINERPEPPYSCCNERCNNKCPGGHDPNHCYRFIGLSHSCNHHCGGAYQCDYCRKDAAVVYACRRCGQHHCPEHVIT